MINIPTVDNKHNTISFVKQYVSSDIVNNELMFLGILPTSSKGNKIMSDLIYSLLEKWWCLPSKTLKRLHLYSPVDIVRVELLSNYYKINPVNLKIQKLFLFRVDKATCSWWIRQQRWCQFLDANNRCCQSKLNVRFASRLSNCNIWSKWNTIQGDYTFDLWRTYQHTRCNMWLLYSNEWHMVCYRKSYSV